MATRSPKSADMVAIDDVDADTTVATPASAEGARVQLKLRELVERVVERTGARKNDVKLIAEATLAVLGAALADGEDLNLPPLGKVMVKRDDDNDKARILTVKVRQPKAVVIGSDQD